MIEDDFYATIKLKTGEEIFARVIPTQEEGRTLLLVNNPIMISRFKSNNGNEGYKIEPWLKTTSEDLFVLNMSDIVTMTENKDLYIIELHEQFIREISPVKQNKKRHRLVSRKMGYISSVEEAKKLLENIYNNS